ncbi:DUF6892 domain-containing protein [Photobacterium nomapromontoriensis]|uniref:DUF6892 domain-containing protein n=1 Tax=Photobacterium nomapromontoriensis TaxID=2910237 RepID=UPI003D10ADD5
MDENLKLLALDDLYHCDEAIKHRIDDIAGLGLSALIFGDAPKYQWFDCILEVKDLLLSIDITDEQFAKVTLLSGECCETHFLVMPNWDGEGDEFNIQSFSGIEKMKNLSCLELLDLSVVTDAERLLELKLDEVNDCLGLTTEVVEKLIENGTVVN